MLNPSLVTLNWETGWLPVAITREGFFIFWREKMINEIFKKMAMDYERNKERESKLIGKKKSTIQVNNFLFIPTEAYLEMIKEIYNLKEENLKPL